MTAITIAVLVSIKKIGRILWCSELMVPTSWVSRLDEYITLEFRLEPLS